MIQETTKISIEELAQDTQEVCFDSMKLLEEKKSSILGILNKRKIYW